jgi:hypothetical protein
MIINYCRLFKIVTSKGKDKVQPPEVRLILAEGTGKEGSEDKESGVMSARPVKRTQHRVAGPRCIECGWSRS